MVVLFLIQFLVLAFGQYVRLPAAQPAHGPVVTTQRIKTPTGANAIIATVHRPVGHFHIYFAGNSTNCFGRQLTSVQSGTHQCAFATNGGPFSYKAPECQGYIASDGNIILDASSTNEVIGLTRSNEWVLGQLTTRNVHQLGFLQLITGFGWLSRHGKISPGKGGEIAPRTFGGINDKGELLIFVVDGYEAGGPHNGALGATLYQAAELALHYGCNNSVNLDGGGSTAAASLGKLVSRPTCHDTPEPVCERAITTITCVKL